MGRSEYDQTNMGAYDYTDRLVAGAEVYGADNEKIGTVADVGQNYFLVQKGWLFIKDLYLPTSTIMQADSNAVYLSLTKQEAEQMGRDELPTAGDAWYGTQRTGTTTTGTGYAANTGYATDREVGRTVNEGENVSVPIVEEQLKAGVRETEAGRARIVKDVTEEEQTIDVPVEREEVYITERAVNRPATEADLSMRERDIEIPLKDQEVVTQKQAMVTGEVNVRKETVRNTEQVTDTVRREDVRVEDPSNPRVHIEDERGMRGQGTDTTVTDQREYDARGNLVDRQHSETPGTTARTGGTTDTAYDRTGMAGDRYETDRRNDEGILDRAKDKMRGTDETMRNR